MLTPFTPHLPSLTHHTSKTRSVSFKGIDEYEAQAKLHAELKAKTTPVLSPGDESLKPVSTMIEIKKIFVGKPEDKRTDLSIIVDGCPWPIQPTPTDKTDDWLLGHDILRHILMGAHGVCNLPNPGGEVLTGDIVSYQNLLPQGEMEFIGRLGRYLEHDKCTTQVYGCLYSFASTLRDPGIPVGSSVQMKFLIHPPDRCYVYDGPVGSPQAPIQINSVTENFVVKPLLKPVFIKDAVIQEQALIKRIQEGENIQVDSEKDGEMNKLSYHHPIPMKEGLEVVYEFWKDPTSQETTKACKRYQWKNKEFEDGFLCQQEAEFLESGKPPEAVLNLGTEDKPKTQVIYRKTSKKTGTITDSVFTKSFNTILEVPDVSFHKRYHNAYPVGEKTVYTGHPYKKVEVESVKLSFPEGALSARRERNIRNEFEYKVASFIPQFKILESRKEELLAQGGFPYRLYEGGLTFLKNQGVLTKDAPLILDGGPSDLRQQLSAFYQNWDQKYHYPRNREFSIAEFPPPPYRVPDAEPNNP